MNAVAPGTSGSDDGARVFRLPDLGEGLTTAQVVTWLVAEGDEVTVDQPVAEVETAKAAVEVPVPFAGRVASLHAAPGETVAVGAPLISVAAGTPANVTTTVDTSTVEKTTPVDATTTVDGSLTADGVAEAAEAAAGSGNVLVGYGTSEPSRRRRRRAEVVEATPALAEPGVVTPTAPRGVVSPLVRRLAKEQGLNLAALDGDGVITRAEVDRAVAAAVPAAPVAGARVPFSATHRAMADTLTRSRREIPEATVWVDVDATDLLAARRRLNTGRDEPVSLLALVARFCVSGLRHFPALNARVDGDAIVLSDAVHLGIAAQTERGLSVPVLHDAQSLDLDAVSSALRELTGRARQGSLSPADLTGGTFTLNNYGPFGVDGSAAIINPPQVAIVGLGRIIERPWVVDGQIVVRSVTELTLAFDHRACDGGTAGGFLRFVADCIENPLRAL